MTATRFSGPTRGLRYVPATVMAGLLAISGVASADVVPQRSAAGVRIEMSAPEAKRLLGEPDAVRRIKDVYFGATRRHRYRARRLTVSIASDNHGVFSVFTRSRLERTRSGVGVGSTEKEVRRGLSGEACEKKDGRVRLCFTGGSGGVHTIYRFRERTVSSVELRKVVNTL